MICRTELNRKEEAYEASIVRSAGSDVLLDGPKVTKITWERG